VPKPLTKLPVFPEFSDVATFAATPTFTKTVHRIAKTPYFHAKKMLNGVAPPSGVAPYQNSLGQMAALWSAIVATDRRAHDRDCNSRNYTARR